jgi:DNA-binding response OmpR family regulator
LTEERQKILVVDDEITVRTFLKKALERAGYDVALAANGQEALNMLSEGGISLVLLDIMMPGLDGFEILELIPQKLNIPVIMLSGISDQATKIQSLGLGADDFIEKPFSIGELITRIQVKLRRTKPSS